MSETDIPIVLDKVEKVPRKRGKARTKPLTKKAKAVEPVAHPQPEPEPEPEPEVVAPTKKARKKPTKKETVVAPEVVEVKTSDKNTKMTDDQKSSLKEYMLDQHADGKMTVSEGKSMRMKLMSRMRKGMTLEEARKDIA